MELEGTTALVTGANRGLGRHFTEQLLARGARKVYAAVRDPERAAADLDLPGVEVVRLDLTDPATITAAAATADDVTLLINNAGISTYTDLVTGDLDAIRSEFDTNFYGPLATTRAFAPILGANGGGAILNVLSRMSWLSMQGANAYAASKAAAWSLTNGVRLELAAQGTLVTGLYISATDTDMMAGWDIPKNDPADVVRAALDGIAAGAWEVIGDEDIAVTKRGLSEDPRTTYGALVG